MPADWCWQLFVFQTITGAWTPACLFAASDPVETVTPPIGVKIPCDSFYYCTCWMKQPRASMQSWPSNVRLPRLSIRPPLGRLAVPAHILAQLAIDLRRLLHAAIEHRPPLLRILVQRNHPQQKAGLQHHLERVAQVMGEPANLLRLLLWNRPWLRMGAHGCGGAPSLRVAVRGSRPYLSRVDAFVAPGVAAGPPCRARPLAARRTMR